MRLLKEEETIENHTFSVYVTKAVLKGELRKVLSENDLGHEYFKEYVMDDMKVKHHMLKIWPHIKRKKVKQQKNCSLSNNFFIKDVILFIQKSFGHINIPGT